MRVVKKMAVRNIIKIDEKKCNGCGQCVNACIEGALQLIDGKARLVRDDYCDGLGVCIGSCPQDAITIERREAAEFNEAKVKKKMSAESSCEKIFVCPGQMAKTIQLKTDSKTANDHVPSSLTNWPVQLKLLPAKAEYFENADLLLAADCTAFAIGGFHGKFLAGRILAVGCPKLDDTQLYLDKLTDILSGNKVKSLTVLKMEVPCCSGLAELAKTAVVNSEKLRKINIITISLGGEILSEELVEF